MRHYEIIVVVHPDQSEQVGAMVDRYKSIIESKEGSIHRFEDWGRRQLSYMMNKAHKAHYILMNVECSNGALLELQSIFRFNDAILRHSIIKMKTAVTEPSAVLQERDERKDTRPGSHNRPSNDRRERNDENSHDYHNDDEHASA